VRRKQSNTTIHESEEERNTKKKIDRQKTEDSISRTCTCEPLEIQLELDGAISDGDNAADPAGREHGARRVVGKHFGIGAQLSLASQQGMEQRRRNTTKVKKKKQQQQQQNRFS
jgi:hypothetical protein